jgi:hypothetical protein
MFVVVTNPSQYPVVSPSLSSDVGKEREKGKACNAMQTSSGMPEERRKIRSKRLNAKVRTKINKKKNRQDPLDGCAFAAPRCFISRV